MMTASGTNIAVRRSSRHKRADHDEAPGGDRGAWIAGRCLSTADDDGYGWDGRFEVEAVRRMSPPLQEQMETAGWTLTRV